MQLSAAHVDNTLQCSSPGMVRQQRSICLKNPGVLSSISLGVQLAIYECQDQFSDRRWNCSTTENGLSVFGKITDRSKYLFPFAYAIVYFHEKNQEFTSQRVVFRTGFCSACYILLLGKKKNVRNRSEVYFLVMTLSVFFYLFLFFL